MNKRSVAPGAGVCRARRLLRLDRKKMTSADNRKSEQYDAWYVKVVFGVFLCVLARIMQRFDLCAVQGAVFG